MHNALKAKTLVNAEGKRRRVLEGDELPISVVGERVLIKPNPPDDETEGGIYKPEVAKMKPFSGRLYDAGLGALDKLHDNGILIGDEVWWGKFAGVIEEWDHVVTPGKTAGCPHTSWRRTATPSHGVDAYSCVECEAVRWIEPMIVANVDDLIGSVELTERRRAGEVAYDLAKTASGNTQHVITRI